MNRAAIASFAIAVALAGPGCGPEKRSEGPGPRETNQDKPRTIESTPKNWETNATPEANSPDTFVVSDWIDIQDTEANAQQELLEKVCKRAVELRVKDLLRDDEIFQQNENELRRLFINQYTKYIQAREVVQAQRFGDNRKLGIKAKVTVAGGALGKAMQQEGMWRQDQGAMRTIIMFRKPPAGSDEASGLEDQYMDEIADNISREMNDRQFQAKLWKDVRLSIAEKRDSGDKVTENLLVKYVEESDWRKPEDERYALPMILLRSEGRLLVGFRIRELVKRDLSFHCTVQVDAYDLFNTTSLGSMPISQRKAIEAGMTLQECRTALVKETSLKAMASIADSLQSFLDQQRRLKKKSPAYTFTFEGYNEHELAKIESIIAGVIAEDTELSNDGTKVVAKGKIQREPIPVRDEIMRTLKLLGLSSKPALRSGTTMTFRKGE